MGDVVPADPFQGIRGVGRARDGKREGLPPAQKLALDRRAKSFARAKALIWIGFYGDASHRATIEPLLADTTLVSKHCFGGEPHRDVLIRDVALGVTIHLSGGKPMDCGPKDVVFGVDLSDPKKYTAHAHWMYFGFVNATSREATLAKWRRAEEGKR